MTDTITMPIGTFDDIKGLFGNLDENLHFIEEETGASIRVADDGIHISGGDTEIARTVISKMLLLQKNDEIINRSRIRYAIDLAKEGTPDLIDTILTDIIITTNRGKRIKCKTAGQNRYIQQIRRKNLVFGIGPAGTGKTYLAVAMAVQALKNKEVERIILTRPAVEAGEKLGFLPGDLQSKVDPYLRPLYDALQEFLGNELYHSYIERGIIEVAPLAYMRGRTLNSAFIILDEAQNCSKEQMKMFLTRFGEGSKVVVTGDITQIDLPEGKKSGLIHATHVLKNVEEIGIVHLTGKDVVRHELVQKIIHAYEAFQKETEKTKQ